MKEELKELATAIKGYVQKSVSDLSDRIKALESREVPTIEDIVKSIPVPKDGANGLDGDHGTDGINGKDGDHGTDGINGKDGDHGKDALEIEIMPSIDAEKSYPRFAIVFARLIGCCFVAMPCTTRPCHHVAACVFLLCKHAAINHDWDAY